MDSKEVVSLAQLVSAMRSATYELQRAERQKDAERFAALKKELLSLQEKIERIL